MTFGRADNSIDRLPDDLRRLVRSMLAAKKPRNSYDTIIEAVEEKSGGAYSVSAASLSRYWNNVLAPELLEADRRADWSERLAATIAKSLGAEGGSREMEDKLLAVIDGAFFANETDPSAIDPEALLSLRNSIEMKRLKSREIDLKAARLSIDEKRQLLIIERLQRENERLRGDLAQAAESVNPSKLFEAVANRVLSVLSSYAELRPALARFKDNIATRMASEAERFTIEKVA